MLRNVANVKTVILIILIFYVAFGMLFNPNDDTKGMPDAIWGQPVKFEDDSAMTNSGIEQVVADAQRVYVLYTSSKGVVQVYDYDGNYLHSIRLYTHLNGAFEMAVNDNVLYIEDYHADIYVFEDGEFVEFLKDDTADAIREAIPYSKFQNNTEGYEIRKGSVWHVDGQTHTCIVNRPARTAIYQNNFDKLIMVVVVAVFALCFWYFQKKKAC